MNNNIVTRMRNKVATVKNRYATKALILAYHRIIDAERDPWAMCVSPDHFAQHLEILTRHTHALSLPELTQQHRNNNVPAASVVISFDDGYVDNLNVATRLLDQYEVPATIFITTGQIGSNQEFWWDELERLLLVPDVLPNSLSLNLNGKVFDWTLGNAAKYSEQDRQQDRKIKAWESHSNSRLSFYYSVWKQLRRLSDTERQNSQAQIKQWADIRSTARDDYRALTEQEVQTMSQHPLIEIGAHTVSHPSLPMRSIVEQKNEIEHSKQHLEDITGQSVNHFAYPHGDYSSDTVKLVSELGFASACVLENRSVEKHTDPFQFPRLCVDNWNGEKFEKKLQEWIKF